MLPIKRLALLTLVAVLPTASQIITGGGGGGGGGSANFAQNALGTITGAVNLPTAASTAESYTATSMTGNVVFSWSPGPPSAGTPLFFSLIQDVVGFHSCTFPGGFPNVFDCSKAGPGVQINISGMWQGTSFQPAPTFSTFSAGICIETGAPTGNPPSGVIWTWCDAATHAFLAKNSSGVITSTVSLGNGVFAALDQTAGNAIWAQLNPTTSNTFTAGKTNITQDSATTAAVRMTGTAAPSSPVGGDLGMSLLGNFNWWNGSLRQWAAPFASENPCTANQVAYTVTTTPSQLGCDPQFIRTVPAANKVLYTHLAGSAQNALGDSLECWKDQSGAIKFCIGLDNSGDPLGISWGDPSVGTTPEIVANSTTFFMQQSGGTAIDVVLRHLRGTGGVPALTACGGGSPAISGSDLGGTVTEGTTATGCTITFATAYAAAPHCAITSEAGLGFTYTLATNQIVITNVGALSSTKLDYVCTAN